MLTENTLQRLAFIRYLYSVAVDQSRQPEPLRVASVLTFHDSIELFLDLACDQFGISSKKTREFKDYWNALEEHLKERSLFQKRSMERLNMARVSFKHHGNMPSSSDIEKFRVNVTDFFEENTPLIFGIEFSRISMTNLIQNMRVKTLLDEATHLIEQEQRGEALNKIAFAFAHLLDDYKYRFLRKKHLPSLSGVDLKTFDRRFVDYVKNVADSVENLWDAMSIISLGFAYQRYAEFKRLTPYVVMYAGRDDYDIPFTTQQGELPSLERCNFCYDFVVENAIRLQNFNFEVEK